MASAGGRAPCALVCALAFSAALLAAPWLLPVSFAGALEAFDLRAGILRDDGQEKELKAQVQLLQEKIEAAEKSLAQKGEPLPAAPTATRPEVAAPEEPKPKGPQPTGAAPGKKAKSYGGPQSDGYEEDDDHKGHQEPRAQNRLHDVAATEGGKGSDLHACMRHCACDRSNTSFFASSAEARNLFVGCDTSKAAKKRPHLVVIGTEKGGSTSLKVVAPGHYCLAERAEPHFFDRMRWHNLTPVTSDIEKFYTERQWGHCQSPQMPLFEKTPSYYLSPHTPLRMCQALGRQNLHILLRNPINRAYSSFYQFAMRYSKISSKGPEGFDRLARVDVAIHQECGGLPTGDPRKDEQVGGVTFAKCCDKVAQRFLLHNWPGCYCQILPDQWKCHHYGEKAFGPIRTGIYVAFMRNWFRFHKTQNLMVTYSESFFDNMPGAGCEVRCFAEPKTAMELCSSWAGRDWNTAQAHSKASGQPPMWESTRQFLQDFYAPYNKQLFELLGRPANWNDPGAAAASKSTGPKIRDGLP